VLRQAVAGRIQITSGFLNELVRDDILRQKNLELELTPLQTELWKTREEIQPKLLQSDPPLDHEFTSLKGAIDVLRSIAGTVSEDLAEVDATKATTNWRRNEIAIASMEAKRLQQCLTEQNKANAALEKCSISVSCVDFSERSSSSGLFTMRE
jgi:predicted RNase H-like nuclease (RuvC/YqgF family)